MSSITEILKIKGKQEFIITCEGYIAIEGGGTYKGYDYLIVLNKNAHRCGYISIPKDRDKYRELNINCHGGLTFVGSNHQLKDLLTTPDNDVWIGFDCGHFNDGLDIESFKKYFGKGEHDKLKSFLNVMNNNPNEIHDFNYLEKECHSIINQLIEAEK